MPDREKQRESAGCRHDTRIPATTISMTSTVMTSTVIGDPSNSELERRMQKAVSVYWCIMGAIMSLKLK